MVRKPPIVFCIVFEKNIFFYTCHLIFCFFGRGARAWLELAHRLSLCDLSALQSFIQGTIPYVNPFFCSR